jgi:hypothetical protein
MDRLEDQIEELEEEIETLGESGRVKEALRKEQILNQVKVRKSLWMMLQPEVTKKKRTCFGRET